MEIKDLKPNAGNVDLVLEVVDKEEPRTFEKFGKEGRVCNVKAKDGSGEVKMTLWNEDVDKVNAGDKIHLQNGWCSEFKGEIQISSGKFGKIEIVEQGNPEVLTNDPNILNPGMAQPESEDDVDVIDEEESVE
jgi:replication factor A1